MYKRQPEPQPGQQPETPPEQVEETAAPAQLPSPTNAMVGINATNQGYAMVQPWSKENPAYSQGFGIYLGDGNSLTAANIVYSASFVEVTSADGSQTVPVIVTAFDPVSYTHLSNCFLYVSDQIHLHHRHLRSRSRTGHGH